MSEALVIKHDSPEALANSMAITIESICQEDIEQEGKASIVLPGGNSPKLLIAALTKQNIDWKKTLITTTDERRVPFENTNSNAGEIFRLFKSHGVTINIHWLCNNEPELFTPNPASITILGMGNDGHFASLFPGTQSYNSKERLIQCIGPTKPKERISFTLNQLLNTRHLVLLVNTKEKWAVCEQARSDTSSTMPVSVLFNRAGSKLKIHRSF